MKPRPTNAVKQETINDIATPIKPFVTHNKFKLIFIIAAIDNVVAGIIGLPIPIHVWLRMLYI